MNMISRRAEGKIYEFFLCTESVVESDGVFALILRGVK